MGDLCLFLFNKLVPPPKITFYRQDAANGSCFCVKYEEYFVVGLFLFVLSPYISCANHKWTSMTLWLSSIFNPLVLPSLRMRLCFNKLQHTLGFFLSRGLLNRRVIPYKSSQEIFLHLSYFLQNWTKQFLFERDLEYIFELERDFVDTASQYS